MAFVLFLLVWSDVSTYIYGEPGYEFSVDKEVGTQMQINVDMTVAMKCHCEYFPALECLCAGRGSSAQGSCFRCMGAASALQSRFSLSGRNFDERPAGDIASSLASR